MTTMPAFDVMDLLPAVIVCLGAVVVWMFWEIEQQPQHRHNSQLRWRRLTANSQKPAREMDRAPLVKRSHSA